MNIVTRISPSPSGNLVHAGNVRTLLYNYLLAKKHGGKFLVRLEDTDRERYNPDFLSNFKETLEWLGIEADYSYWNPDPKIGSFIQSERDYSHHLKYLLENNLAYYDFSSKKEVDEIRVSNPNFVYDHSTRMNMKNSLTLSNDEVNKLLLDKVPYVIRFKVEPNINITFDDAILGNITINSSNLDDKVLLKSNGIGSYHLCNVCDDHDMEITHVLRGQEWVNSTPFHILLYRSFNWKIPTFAHLPLIMNPDGKGKLSKRTAAKFGIPISAIGYYDNDGNFQKGFREHGYEPEALLNLLVLIGWSSPDDKEILSIDEMIERFSLDRIHKSGARFDIDKAKWFNHHYIKNKSYDELSSYLDKGDNRYIYDSKITKEIIDLSIDRSTFVSDMKNISDIFFYPIEFNSKVNTTDEFKSVFEDISIFDIEWNKENIKHCIFSKIKERSFKTSKILTPLREAITGGIPGPDLITTIYCLGKNETINRISNYLKLEEVELC